MITLYKKATRAILKNRTQTAKIKLTETLEIVSKGGCDSEMNKKILVLEGQAYSLEKEGKLDEAKNLYWQIINEGFTGSFPYERLRIICAQRKEWEEAVKVCRRYVDLNASYSGYNVKSQRMQELIRKYEAMLDANVGATTAETVLAHAVKNASASARERRHVSIPEYRITQVFPYWAREEIVLESATVPEFQKYFPTELDMNSSQRNFYDKWKHNWKQGKPIDVKGNVSYLFAYTYGVISSVSSSPQKAINELRLLQHVYKAESRFAQYLTYWIFNAYLLVSDYMTAMAYLESRTGVEKINHADRLFLSLKYKRGLPITGEDVISMYNIRPRKIVLDNLDILIDWLDEVIKDFEERNGVDLLALVTEQFAFHESSEIHLFAGIPFIHPKIQLDIFNYSALGDFNIVLNQWLKDAENRLRKEKGLPKIGEGWISETMLYNLVAMIFTEMGYDVVHHSYPPFLQRQELDIYIPALKLGIEYMGKQHYEPIDFFGGQRGFQETKERDERKRRFCREHGLVVLDFKYDEPIEENYVCSKLKEYISIARVKT
jgi:hypothetical protein